MSQFSPVLTNRATVRSCFLNTWLQISALLISLVFTLQASSQNETPRACIMGKDKVELCSIQIVDQDGTKRVYKYEIKRAAPGSPTVLSIPGGPGGTTVGQTAKIVSYDRMPENFGFIAIDPRGVGVNKYGPDPQGKIYSQQKIVQDIVAVLDSEKPSKYIIYGYSHGSVLATELAAEVTKEGSEHPKPTAVLIGGVLSKALANPEDYRKNFNVEFSRLTNALSESEKQVLKVRLATLRDQGLKGDSQKLAELMATMLFLASPVDKGPSLNTKKWIQKMADAKISDQELWSEIGPRFKQLKMATDILYGKSRSTDSMLTVIACQELNANFGDVDFDLDRLQMFDVPSESCEAKGYRLKKPYEAKNFQIRQVPIVYVQGSVDPATPAAGAKEHYNDQKQAAKIYIEMQGFAHTGLMALNECPGFWNAVAQDLSAVKANIETCQEKIPVIKILGYKSDDRFSPSLSRESSAGTR